MKRLPEIQRQIQAIADGKVPPTGAPDVPIVVWFNQGIHGDETASFESAMWLAYNLAASDDNRVTDILDKAVVVINPSYNPDGHERYAFGTTRSRAATRATTRSAHGRVRRGPHQPLPLDLNRDRGRDVQKETQQELAESKVEPAGLR